jgi:hypothetical protein
MALSLSQVITGIRHAASMNDQSALKKNIVEALEEVGNDGTFFEFEEEEEEEEEEN